MSLSKGNLQRNRPQKHQNRTTFKNDLHDTSKKTKTLNALQISGVCPRCKEIIEWKIKYKKYKPLATPRKCVGCDQKNVKQAYHIFCKKCAAEKNVCAKCCKPIENIATEQISHEMSENEIQAMIKNLPERKKRTLLRHLKKQEGGHTPEQIEKLMSEMATIDDDSFEGFTSEEDHSESDNED
ncbi:unnamed protein product [Pieris macdunnoughi]|uniref:Uncharacterized protein n=1 Tax=Pieris macdunnoughi TaxID=345717 RepID=A0A821TZD1_9NEOP|nr:unnamed protein product [Pieris macdunnoughi]